MPSPFPGMDPYLESPAMFPGLHDRFITYLGEALQAVLPEPYYAEIGDRLWVELSNRQIGPDVNVLRREEPTFREVPKAGGTSVAVRSEPVVVTVPQDEVREPFLQIYSRISGEKLVTTIEVLSLANKTGGSHGRELYLRKQREVLHTPTHLVEIDLLRAGLHTTAVPRDLALARAGNFDYHVCVHRFDNLEDYFVYPIRLSERLPDVDVPLLPEHPPVRVDLQTVFDRCYDSGPYHRRVSYRDAVPGPPLGATSQAWIDRLLGEKLGLTR